MLIGRCVLPLLHTSRSPWFLLVLGEKATCQHKEKAEKRQHEKRVTLRGRFQIGVSDDNYKGEHSLLSKWNAGPVPLCLFLPTPCPVRLAGQWDSGPPVSGARVPFRDVSLSGRSCTELGARRCSPNPPSPSRVSGGRSSRPHERESPGPWPPLGRWLDVRFRFRWIGLACSPESWERLRLGRREARGSRRSPRGRGPQDARVGAPTHVALQFPLGGRLDEPAGAHSVACAHRGRRRRRRPFLQLGRPPSAGGSRARDSDGAGPAPARPAPPRAAPRPPPPAAPPRPPLPPPRGRAPPPAAQGSGGEAGGRAPGAPSSKSSGEPVAGPPESARKEPLEPKASAARNCVPRPGPQPRPVTSKGLVQGPRKSLKLKPVLRTCHGYS